MSLNDKKELLKTTRIIVAGPRDYTNKEVVFKELDRTINMLYMEATKNIEIVEGGASGVDRIAQQYAKDCQHSYTTFHADWSRYGKKAGPMRNQKMAEYANVLIAFYNGSKGTLNMIKQAMEYGLYVHIIPID